MNYEEALKLYYDTILIEWIQRGFQNNMPFLLINRTELLFPEWLGDCDFHDSHKSNLLRKYYEYYSKFGWEVPINQKYIWPKK